MAGSSKVAVISALIGNGAIAITKFGAAIFTGSSAMFSEAIHSVVDTGNQGLLLFGMRQAKLPPSEQHPFGRGKELFFWAFIVAMLIFAVGAGLSLYEGLHAIQDPQPVQNAYVNYIVLGLSMIFEGAASALAIREFIRSKGELSAIDAIRHGKDPALFTVVLEDLAALIGLFIAMIGVYLNDKHGILWADGAAAIVIALLLAAVAIVLAIESKALLIGEAAQPEVVARIREILREERRVVASKRIMTMHLAPDEVLLAMDVDFARHMMSAEVEEATHDIEEAIQAELPEVSRIYIEARTLR